MVEMSVHEALLRKKRYDARLLDLVNEAYVVARDPKGRQAVKIDKAVANYQEWNELVKNRTTLNAAIVQSNATTEVEVGGVKMTVASAIERKKSIEFEKVMLTGLKHQLATQDAQRIRANEKINDGVQKNFQAMLAAAKEDDAQIGVLNDIIQKQLEQQAWTLYDPIQIRDQIDALRKKIDAFEIGVDSALTTSNVVTIIQVNL